MADLHVGKEGAPVALGTVVRCFDRIVAGVELRRKAFEHGGIGVARHQDIRSAAVRTHIVKNEGERILRFGVERAHRREFFSQRIEDRQMSERTAQRFEITPHGGQVGKQGLTLLEGDFRRRGECALTPPVRAQKYIL